MGLLNLKLNPFKIRFIECQEFRYILELHRIPAKTKGSRAVFIQHGMLGSSGHWIINPASSSLRIHFYYSLLTFYSRNKAFEGKE